METTDKLKSPCKADTLQNAVVNGGAHFEHPTDLVTINMTSHAPVFTTGLPQQVIMVSELGTNQIILTEIEEASCKSPEPAKMNVESESEHRLIVIDDTSFENLTPVDEAHSDVPTKRSFNLVRGKLYSGVTPVSDVSILPSNNLACLQDSTVNQQLRSNANRRRRASGNNAIDNNKTSNNFEQETRDCAVEHHSSDESGDLGYTAHLLSELSDTRALPTMSSSQVSSVLSALEPLDKQNQPSLESLANRKETEEPRANNLNPLKCPSPEFVKIEGGLCAISKSSLKSNKSNAPIKTARFKKIVLNDDSNQLLVLRCLLCEFLTLKESVLKEHLEKVHSSLNVCDKASEKKGEIFRCIGCSNVFRSKYSLQVHLIEDHEVSEAEADRIISAALLFSVKDSTAGNDKTVIPTADTQMKILASNVTDSDQAKETSFGLINKDSTTSFSPVTVKTCNAVTTFPALQLIVSSNPIVVATDGKCCSSPTSDVDLSASENSSPAATSPTTLKLGAISVTTDTPHEFHTFTANSVTIFSDDKIDESGIEKPDMLKEDENSIEKSLSPEESDNESDNSNLSKRRSQPHGSQCMDIIRPRFKTELFFDKDLGPKCGINDCAVRMRSEINMDYHKQCHTGKLDTSLKCPECELISPHWRNLTSHLWKTHNIDMELYTCELCGYKTNNYRTLVNLHSRIHGDERPFLCDLCGKGFKTTKQLRNHKVIHKSRNSDVTTESKMLSCKICGRKVSDARNLRQHTENVHNKRKPYMCSFCNYAAASPSSLRMHNRQHTGEKPFHCDECNYVTADHNSLRRHKMRHSGSKRYQCPHCSYACIQSTTYKSHLKSKHPGMDEGLMFSCSACPFRTVKKENYLTHTAQHCVKDNSNLNKVGNLRKPRNTCNLTSSDNSVTSDLPSKVVVHDLSRLSPCMLSENTVALQNLVKHVSSSIMPASQIEAVVNNTAVDLHQQPTIVLEFKDGVTIASAVDDQLPVAGLAHGEIIISDNIEITDSDSESMSTELIVPQSQSRT